jgi:excisionase family DNA binding protein
MKKKARSLKEALENGSLLDVPEVAQILNVSIPSIYNWAKQGKIPFFKIGEMALRFDPCEIQAMIDAGRRGGAG